MDGVIDSDRLAVSSALAAGASVGLLPPVTPNNPLALSLIV
jgi:hypothetical protein